MWVYEKKLQYPVKVSTCNPTLAKYLMEQYGGADGELAAALRYLNQRYTIPDKVVGLLNDIGTEEFAHLEMIATMIYKYNISKMQHLERLFFFVLFSPFYPLSFSYLSPLFVLPLQYSIISCMLIKRYQNNMTDNKCMGEVISEQDNRIHENKYTQRRTKV